MKHNSVHVVFHNPRWSVAVEREDLPRLDHLTKEAATEAGRALARQMQTELVVHDPDGNVVERKWYGVLPL